MRCVSKLWGLRPERVVIPRRAKMQCHMRKVSFATRGVFTLTYSYQSVNISLIRHVHLSRVKTTRSGQLVKVPCLSHSVVTTNQKNANDLNAIQNRMNAYHTAPRVSANDYDLLQLLALGSTKHHHDSPCQCVSSASNALPAGPLGDHIGSAGASVCIPG